MKSHRMFLLIGVLISVLAPSRAYARYGYELREPGFSGVDCSNGVGYCTIQPTTQENRAQKKQYAQKIDSVGYSADVSPQGSNALIVSIEGNILSGYRPWYLGYWHRPSRWYGRQYRWLESLRPGQWHFKGAFDPFHFY